MSDNAPEYWENTSECEEVNDLKENEVIINLIDNNMAVLFELIQTANLENPLEKLQLFAGKYFITSVVF